MASNPRVTTVGSESSRGSDRDRQGLERHRSILILRVQFLQDGFDGSISIWGKNFKKAVTVGAVENVENSGDRSTIDFCCLKELWKTCGKGNEFFTPYLYLFNFSTCRN
jgi:hypothetical protein